MHTQDADPLGAPFFPEQSGDDWEDVFKPSTVARLAVTRLPLPAAIATTQLFRELVAPGHVLASAAAAGGPVAIYFYHSATPCPDCRKVRWAAVARSCGCGTAPGMIFPHAGLIFTAPFWRLPV